MKPHIRYIVEGQILGSSLLSQGIDIDKEAQPIEPLRYYAYVTEQTDQGPITIITSTNTFQR